MKLEDSIIGYSIDSTIEHLISEPNRIRSGIMYTMQEEIKLLKSASLTIESVNESIRVAEERIAYMQSLSGQDFQDRYYGKTEQVVALFFLPYHSEKLETNPFLQRQREFKRHEAQIRALFFPKKED